MPEPLRGFHMKRESEGVGPGDEINFDDDLAPHFSARLLTCFKGIIASLNYHQVPGYIASMLLKDEAV